MDSLNGEFQNMMLSESISELFTTQGFSQNVRSDMWAIVTTDSRAYLSKAPDLN